MSNNLPSTRRERRIDFHSEAPFSKHDYRFNSRRDIRLAGKVWEESPRERTLRLARERVKQKSRLAPVNFDGAPSAVPDNDYSTVEFI